MYQIEFAEGVFDDLKQIRAFERTHILDEIDVQLQYEPLKQTRNRKPLFGLTLPWEHIPPIWKLRVGEWRVFYDVSSDKNSDNAIVTVRAIRHKPPNRRTEEIL
ncbi:MAG: type II toxin-antitoxin system RelE/ParE family toxin [Caldilineaceae bacterium]|nr:type II toxin-antitoxin system RelE/ParE family toxin [Caldilineaceae bacterium]